MKPTILPRQQHHISRTLVSQSALRVLYRLKDNGYTALLVGGCVRDLLLGREPKDFDVVTNATPNEIKRMFRNCRLVGRRFRLAHIHFGDEIIEVATFRSQAEPEQENMPEAEAIEAERHHHHRHPKHLKSDEGMILRDNVFGTPEEDALRRDFTVNALAYNIADFSIIDYTGGLADLNAGIIRTIGEPAIRFQEDPVRMLRAVRFAALLGFTIEADTHAALVAAAATIIRSAPPRLYEEVLKLFVSGEGAHCYDLLRRTGLFAALFPHVSTWLTTESDGFPHTRFCEMLAYIDSCVQQGRKLSQPLVLALLFGQYVDDKAGHFRQQGAPWQQSVNAAMATFLGETCPTVMITNRIGLAMRDIIILQMRLKKIPGRRPEALISRPDFLDIIEYCRVTSRDGKSTQLDWWTARAQQMAPLPAQPANQPGAGETHRSSRKRRRRRRSH